MVLIKKSAFSRLRNRGSSMVSTSIGKILIGMGIFSMVLMGMLHPDLTESASIFLGTETKTEEGGSDPVSIKANRKNIVDSCEGLDDAKVLSRITTEMFTRVPTKDDQISPHSPRPDVRKCKNVILDFGANVGDTASHVIDAGLPNCAGELHIDLQGRTIRPQKWNKVTKFLKGMMDATNNSPEDYCYYGVEGNPVFTERLRGIEDYIHSINPKPVEHAAFFTESVGAGEVGMTKLYLDTVNDKENFWGSSIMANHQDVRKSKESANMTEAVYHDVMGYTITELMKMTLIGMDESASDEEKKGGHLLMKVDIEGGEYVLTQEVVQSKALCQFVAAGNTADVIIETHSQRVTGPNPLHKKFGGWKKELEECGVKFQGLQAYWA